MLAALLLVGAVILVATNYKEVREINIFAAVLVVQSLPFLAAVVIAVVEGTRLNEFAYWRSVESPHRRTSIAAACECRRGGDACRG